MTSFLMKELSQAGWQSIKYDQMLHSSPSEEFNWRSPHQRGSLRAHLKAIIVNFMMFSQGMRNEFILPLVLRAGASLSN